MEIITTLSPQKVTSLVNRLAAAKQAADAADSAYRALKAEAIAVLGEGSFETSTAKVTIKETSRPVLDQTKAKGFLTASQLSQCVRDTYYTDLRIKFVEV